MFLPTLYFVHLVLIHLPRGFFFHLAIFRGCDGKNVVDTQQQNMSLTFPWSKPLGPLNSLIMIESSTTECINIYISLSAAINFKNIVTKHWKVREDCFTIDETDKNTIRQTFLECVVKSSDLIR